MSDWQTIKTAPKDGTVIDLWLHGKRVSDCRYLNGYWETPTYAANESEPSHWMPLPEPPKDNPDVG